MAKELLDENLSEVLSSDKLTVLDFWATWCGPCRKVSPIVDELATEYEGAVDIFKCNVEDCSEISAHFGIISIPTLVFLKDGKVLEKHAGTASKQQLVEIIEKYK